MRVIKENNIERQVECGLCKSIIAYKAKDINTALFPTIRCPICGELIKVSKFDKKIKRLKIFQKNPNGKFWNGSVCECMCTRARGEMVKT